MNHPLISILLCTYNGADYLEEQIQSLLHQTYPNIEIIISDDASTDKTSNILKKYTSNPKITINFNEKNVGLQRNIGVAAALSNGRFICFSDQDDYWLPRKVERLFNSIGSYSLVYSDSKLVDSKGNSLNKNLSDFRKLQDVMDSKGFSVDNAVSGHSMMATRELLNVALPIPEEHFHDWWIAVQASNLNGIKYLDEKLTLYRQHTKNITPSYIEKVAGSRSFNKRHGQFIKELQGLELLKNNELEKQKLFYKQFYNLHLQKKKGSFTWPLFWFLIRNKKDIYRFSKKSELSQLNEIRKRSRAEKEM
ncbi:MAG: alpha-L-Rha alpha,3-L-rhamnosyltransferase [Ferruginibacter sp.]|uniref:glycosyltransferase family 2 protein n=1 Tax=Ferruginibacter sp. TaxID=1940288 RepID=UPI00265A292F|nr:glycosyltransferase family 2 protein [Ferruginibacter sp.]MDB5275225.1 alpha-L-Rha alpha,3-L-rhamnosyltransferase [Ferruginibacter sp.]